MPEGPSIVILREEAMLFRGRKVTRVSGNSKAGIDRLKGKKVIDLKSWGKHFLICFDKFYVRIHLLMFGSYRINETKPETEPRLSLKFTNGELNFYSCALKIVDGSTGSDYDWSVDTMSDQWDHGSALSKVKKDKSRIISDVLLDQEIFAGVGNIIKVEALFLSHIHPEAKVSNIPVSKLDELTATTRSYCFDFYRWKKEYTLRKHWQIYRKGICPRCNLKVVIKYVGKTNRRTFFCNNCQFMKRKDFEKLKIE
ncbi:MAG: DNA-formamidopyrimidine glycosylase family protein [Bacteroidia bacterium]